MKESTMNVRKIANPDPPAPAYRNRSQSRTWSKVDFRELGIDNHCLRCSYINHLTKDCRHPPKKFKYKSCSQNWSYKKICSLLHYLKRNRRKIQISYVIDDEDNNQYYNINAIDEDENDNTIMIPLKLNGIECSFE